MEVFFGNHHSDPWSSLDADSLLRSDKPWRLTLVLKGSKLSYSDLGLRLETLLDAARDSMTWTLMCERQVKRKWGPLVVRWTVRKPFDDFCYGDTEDTLSLIRTMNTLNTRLDNIQRFQPI